MTAKIRTLALFLLASGTALACLNTTYSRKEELQVTSDLTRIIMGQFAEHGEAFYLQQVALQSARLADDPADFEARNDLAAALIKLQRYDEAERELLRIDAEQPDRYKTHANLGVLYKKTKQFEKAVTHTRKSLEIKPEGHLGLGDYYLRMLEWRDAFASGDPSTREVNFLGIRYEDGPQAVASSPVVNRQHLLTLIKADRHFPETYLILGDLLFAEGDLQNAARAYVRTMVVEQEVASAAPAAPVASERLTAVTARWREEAEKRRGYIFDHRYQGQIEGESAQAAAWLETFKTVEAELIAAGTPGIDIGAVLQELAGRDLAGLQPSYLEAGLYKGSARGDRPFAIYLFTVAALFVGALLLVGVVLAVRRALRSRRDATGPHPA